MFIVRDPSQRAARELHKAAERAREFAELCDRYADSLSEEGAGAEELRLLTRSKLAEVKEALADSEEWRARRAAVAAA